MLYVSLEIPDFQYFLNRIISVEEYPSSEAYLLGVLLYKIKTALGLT